MAAVQAIVCTFRWVFMSRSCVAAVQMNHTSLCPSCQINTIGTKKTSRDDKRCRMRVTPPTYHISPKHVNLGGCHKQKRIGIDGKSTNKTRKAVEPQRRKYCSRQKQQRDPKQNTSSNTKAQNTVFTVLRSLPPARQQSTLTKRPNRSRQAGLFCPGTFREIMP